MNSRSELQIETNHVSAGTRIEVVVYTSVAGVAEFGVETVILRDDEGILHEEVGASSRIPLHDSSPQALIFFLLQYPTL